MKHSNLIGVKVYEYNGSRIATLYVGKSLNNDSKTKYYGTPVCQYTLYDGVLIDKAIELSGKDVLIYFEPDYKGFARIIDIVELKKEV